MVAIQYIRQILHSTLPIELAFWGEDELDKGIAEKIKVMHLLTSLAVSRRYGSSERGRSCRS